MEFQSEEQNWILWKDSNLLVLNKPAGILSLPDGYDRSQPYLQSILEPMFGRLWVVHRLDRDTSGLIVLARSAQAHHLLNDQFSGRLVHKTYHAIIAGTPEWQEQEIDLPLRKNGDRRHRTVFDPRAGKPAQTFIQVIERFSTYTLVHAFPKTGYTHQIRAHLSAIGFPLVGDPLYGGPENLIIGDNISISRVALHAYQIDLFHPITGQPLQFIAPYPPDFSAALSALHSSIA